MTVLHRSTCIEVPARIGPPKAIVVTGGQRYQFCPVIPACHIAADRLEVAA